MVGESQRAVADAAGDADELHICVVVAYINLYLLDGSGAEKAGGSHGKDFFAAGSKAGGNSHQILLGDTYLDKLLRKGIGKFR